jgi:hypothetical protein
MEQTKQVELPGIIPWIQRRANAILPSRIALMIPISIRPLDNTQMQVGRCDPRPWCAVLTLSGQNWSTGSVAYLSSGEGLPTSAGAMHKRLHSNSAALNVLKQGWLPTIAFWAIQLTGQAP